MRFTIFETGLVALFAALAAWTVTAVRNPLAEARDPELAPFEQRYGPAKWSAGPEEWLIRDYFADKHNGVFLDVGAGHYRDDSNTYFLERDRQWTGVAVDAVDSWADGYRANRPGTRFHVFFVSDRSDADATLFVNPLDRRLSSATQSMPASRGPTFERTVRTITLNDLLATAGVETIDLMSMDIELSEPPALEGFDIGRFRPALVCIEAHLDVRQAIVNYFAANDYRIVARYLRADRANLYFEPAR